MKLHKSLWMVLKIKLYVRPVTDLKQPKPPFSPNPKKKSLPEKDSTALFKNSDDTTRYNSGS